MNLETMFYIASKVGVRLTCGSHIFLSDDITYIDDKYIELDNGEKYAIKDVKELTNVSSITH